ncbi:hypothetical protein ACGF8B_35465 [Streptomyces sp. NPDC047917]|uniref:hypothetical protein n=1 Tax=Streptomyces sp. NPDC047917 TaxID=3365491 RepID=UPI00371E5E0E
MTVGYGYRPRPAGIWRLALTLPGKLTLLGNLAFRTQSPIPVEAGEGLRCSPSCTHSTS